MVPKRTRRTGGRTVEHEESQTLGTNSSHLNGIVDYTTQLFISMLPLPYGLLLRPKENPGNPDHNMGLMRFRDLPLVRLK